jgi:iron complex outermembrane receptor protein
LRLLGYIGQRSNEQFQAIPLGNQNAITSAGGVSAFDRDFGGVGVRWTRRGELAAKLLTLSIGADYDIAQDDRKGYRNDNGVQGALKRDESNTVDSWGGYVQAEWQVSQTWSVSAGLRYTDVAFESEDFFICTTTVNTTGTPLGTCSGSTTPVTGTPGEFNPDDSGSVSYSAWTPVAGVVYKLSPTTNLYANVGKSFETPTFIELAYRPDGSSGLNFGLQPSISYHYEVGVKAIVLDETLVEMAIFAIDTSDEIVVATNAGGRQSFQNAGDTQRRGAELSINSTLGRGLNAFVSATYLQAEFKDTFLVCGPPPCTTPSVPVNAGNRIPAVPRYTIFGDLSWRHQQWWGFFAGLEARWQGDVPVNDINSEFADDYFVASARAGFEQRAGDWRFSEFARIDNILDEEYIGAVYVNDANSRFYAPAPERNYLFGVNVSYAF